jgi:cytidylate kinase
LALQLGFKYLDTGIMYRAITWLALRHRASLDDEAALGKLAEDHPVRLQGQNSDEVLVGDYRVGPELREAQVNGLVSLVARVSAVRRALVRQQRVLATEGSIIMVGRDIGTVVLPDADLKVYLSASPESRAGRRWREMINQGQSVEFQQVLSETRARDEMDSHRADSPLAPAEDAFLLDTEQQTAEQVVQRILERIQELAAASEP